MQLYEIAIPKDNAWDIMNELGNLSCMHFVDLNKNEQVFNLTYAPTIKRCEDADRKITYLMGECKKFGVKIRQPDDIKSFLSTITTLITQKKKAANLFFEEIESDVDHKAKYIEEHTMKMKSLHDECNNLRENIQVLQDARSYIIGGLSEND